MASRRRKETVIIWSRIKAPLLRTMTQSKYLAIWVAFVLLMVLTPFTSGPIGSIVLSIVFSFVLISGILTVSNDRALLVIGLIPLSIAISLRWIAFFTDNQDLQTGAALFGALTLSYVTLLVFSALLKSKDVTSTVIWQAISVYLLIGLTWSMLFLFVEGLSPGSFVDNSGSAITYPVISYYSFVTLATLGYGDVVPVSSVARGLAVLEVLSGVLYMAILISRLVGTWTPGTKK
jgi:hypothetical protein